MNFRHKLMENNFNQLDINTVINFLKSSKNNNLILTQSKYVKKFEKNWSKWLGVKYSVFVNSGSSANFLSMSILKILKKGGEVIVPTLTWVSDVNSVIYNGFKPIFVDINPKNLCMDEDKIIKKINNKTVAIFMTHAQGFNGLTTNLLKILKKRKIELIEDVCESHGATFNKKKLGTFGLMSNFSFYYAHHMSTIEGGMISTNNKKIYQIARSLRSHGMLREIDSKIEEKKIIKKYPKLSPKFIFIHKGFNFRNNEIGGLLGLSQLKRLDRNIKKRNENFRYFLKNLDKNYFVGDYNMDGISNYAFPLILKKKSFVLRKKLEETMKKYKIEYRRGNAGGGNQLRQPYISQETKHIKLSNFKNVEHIHFFGYYIGNYPGLKKNKILKLKKILNSFNT